MNEEKAWAIYQQQVLLDERDRRLRNAVTLLQGIAAIVSIVSFFLLLQKK